MKNLITNLVLTFLAVSTLASDPRFTDHTYNISYPEKIGGLTFHSIYISESHRYKYEVQYSGDVSSCDLLLDLIPNDRTYSIYESKTRVRYTKPVSELSNGDLIKYEWGEFLHKPTTLFDWQDYHGVSSYAYSTKSVSVNIRDNGRPPSGEAKEEKPRICYKCISIFRFQNFTLIATRQFNSEEGLRNNHKQTIDQIMKLFSNQRFDPIVKTPVDEVEAQGTQGHP